MSGDCDLRAWLSHEGGASSPARFEEARVDSLDYPLSKLTLRHGFPHFYKHVMRKTSLDAFESLIGSGVLGDQERRYLVLLYGASDGLTDGEASLLLGLPRSTVSARRNGCVVSFVRWCDNERVQSERLIVDSGERRKNPGEKSKAGIVWVIR